MNKIRTYITIAHSGFAGGPSCIRQQDIGAAENVSNGHINPNTINYAFKSYKNERGKRCVF